MWPSPCACYHPLLQAGSIAEPSQVGIIFGPTDPKPCSG
jgi:hypothetical protein